MNSSHFTTVLRYVRRLAVQDGTSLHSDQQLLARYQTHKDEAAFAVLVQRHGSLVWNVCRRVLADANDADDVFQATFLVLLNKASSLHGRQSLAGWLQGVAWRLARKVKAQAAHRQEKEARTSVSHSPADSETANRRELRSILDEELLRLPSKYRDPVILCYLEGKTYTEAAAHLGWAAGTVSGRLARARTLLGHRLARRGVGLAVIAGAFPELAMSPAPAASIAAVEQMARIFLVGRGLAFGSSTTVGGLARWATQAWMFSNFKVVAGLAAFIGVLALGAGLTTQLFRHDMAEHASDDSPVALDIDEPELIATTATRKDFYGDPLPPGALARKLFEMPWPDDLLSKNPGATAGSLAATGNYDGTILVWDLKSGKAPANWSRSKKLERAELESLWTDLAADARTAQPSVHLLAAASNQAVPFLAERLRPVANVDHQEVNRLIKDLSSDEFATQELANRTLSRLGAQIEPALTRALAAKPAREVRVKLEACLRATHAPCIGETRRTVRAIQVLAMVGTPAARQVLQKLATGAEDALETRTAREGLVEFASSH